MKKYLTIIPLILIVATTWAQVPNKMSYQGVIRNTSNELIKNTSIGMQISILHGSPTGAPEFVERHFPTTNSNGLVTLEIGTGALVLGDISNIDWSGEVFYLKTETDINGGANYTITGVGQLLSVPYAMHAKTAEIITGAIAETDPEFKSSEAANITATDITNLSNLSGTNTGDQEISGIEVNAQAIQDSTSRIRADIPNVPPGTQMGDMQYWNGSEWVIVSAGTKGQVLTFTGGVPTWTTTVGVGDVYNPTTGKVWMDRNLGASQVAESSNDANAYGDLYQWGRGTDRHEKRTSGTTSKVSDSDIPGHGNFIITSSNPYDWRSPQNDNLWQSIDRTNKPCPSGYRLPTEAEWEAERQSWGSNDAAGAFASPLKLTMAGHRAPNGTLYSEGSTAYYWSSTVSSTSTWVLYFHDRAASVYTDYRGYGRSVRCIKE